MPEGTPPLSWEKVEICPSVYVCVWGGGGGVKFIVKSHARMNKWSIYSPSGQGNSVYLPNIRTCSCNHLEITDVNVQSLQTVYANVRSAYANVHSAFLKMHPPARNANYGHWRLARSLNWTWEKRPHIKLSQTPKTIPLIIQLYLCSDSDEGWSSRSQAPLGTVVNQYAPADYVL